MRRSLGYAALGVSLVCSLAGIMLNIALPMIWQAHDEQYVTIVSGSMSPTIGVGDVILVKDRTDDTIIKVGDIVTFRGENHGELFTSHRVIDIFTSPKLDGQYLRTQGDANPEPDADSVSESAVVGVYEKNLGMLGIAVREAQLPVWRLVAFGPPLLILALLELPGVWQRAPRPTPPQAAAASELAPLA